MLSLTAAASVALTTREPSCTGASLSWQIGSAVRRDGAVAKAAAPQAAAESAVMYPRPRVRSGASVIGGSAQQADQAKFALPQLTNQKYAHKTTRIAAAGGGELGSHPARDPV